MNNILQRNRRDILAFAVLFAALVLRISWFGFTYNLQLDDYIHYRAYPAGTDYLALCVQNGLFASRPFAALSDFWVWARLPYYLGSVILCAMYAWAGVLFLRLFRKYFSTGFFFLVVFALLPLGFEATYWQAAATRVLPPLLFAALAVTAYDRFCDTKKWLYLIPFLGWSFLSFCFYEQLLVLSLALTLMLMLLQLLQKRWHSLLGLLVFLPVLGYAAFTGHFAQLASGGLSARMNTILPTDPDYFTTFLPNLLNQMGMSFLDGGWLTLSWGLSRGLEILFREGVWAALLIPVAAVCMFFSDKACRCDEKGKFYHLAPVFGFLAALAPLTPFFIIAKPWFSLRNTAASFLGLALMADYLVRVVLRNRTAVVTALAAALCLTASVSELYDYKATADNNARVAEAVIAADEAMDLTGSVGILGLNQNYALDQNYYYHDHVLSAHASGWSLTGLLRFYQNGAELDFEPTPLPTDGEYYWNVWNESVRRVEQYDTLLLYDHATGSITPLTAQEAEGEWLLYFSDGTPCGRVWEDASGYGHIDFFDN